MKANKTQEYLMRKEIQFSGNDLWPGNSPDLNPTENLGEVVKNRVEEKMHKEIGPGRYSEETLLKNLNMVLDWNMIPIHLKIYCVQCPSG